MVNGGEDAFTGRHAGGMAPIPDDRIELGNELSRRNLRLAPDDGSHLL